MVVFAVALFRSEQKAMVESEPKPLLKLRQMVEPRPQATDEPAQPDDADEPAALPGPAQEIQSLFQPIEQPQPDRPPSPPPKPEVIYSDQVSCHCKPIAIYTHSPMNNIW